MKAAIADGNLSQQMSVLRARIETKVATPGIIIVTSAAQGDGKSLVASGIAESFASAGYRVALVDASDASLTGRPESNDGRSREPSRAADVFRFAVADDQPSLVKLAFASETKQISKSHLVSLVENLRGVYDFAVVDTTRLTGIAAAMLFAAIADGVLLTICEGRRADRGDRKTIAALEAVNATLLGVVSVRSSAIEAFATRRVSFAAPAKVRLAATSSDDAAPKQPAATNGTVTVG